MASETLPHIALYSRVSTSQQDFKSQDADLQRYADSQVDPVVWYRDKFTGRTMNRPGWLKLENAMRSRKVLRVVVWRLDRLGRTTRDLAALFEELTAHRIGLVSMREGIDLSTPSGRMIANVLASIAQFETEVRGERVLAGQAAARAVGKRWGGSSKGRRLHVNDDQIKTIHLMFKSGEKIAAIARAVGLSRTTIYQYLPKE